MTCIHYRATLKFAVRDLQAALAHGFIALYLTQDYCWAEGHVAILYQGHAVGNLMDMPMGIGAPSCPRGSAHPRDRLYQMGPCEQMESTWQEWMLALQILQCIVSANDERIGGKEERWGQWESYSPRELEKQRQSGSLHHLFSQAVCAYRGVHTDRDRMGAGNRGSSLRMYRPLSILLSSCRLGLPSVMNPNRLLTEKRVAQPTKFQGNPLTLVPR